MILDRLVLIDGNHLMHRAFWKFKNLSTFDGEPTSIIYGAPYILESLIRRLSPDKLIVVFDSSRSQYRKDILPGYKERESRLGDKKESFHNQKEVLIDLLNSFGVSVYRSKGYEADDIIAYLSVKHFRSKKWETVIVSADKDFVQLINRNIMMYNVSKNIMIEEFTSKDYMGYTPRECVDFLCLLGDDSDKIPGYKGIGPAKARKILDEFGSVRKFLRSDKDFGKIDKALLKEIYERNYKLIDLMHFIRKVLKPEDIKPITSNPKMDMEKLKYLLSKYQINTFLKPQFLNTYKHLSNEK